MSHDQKDGGADDAGDDRGQNGGENGSPSNDLLSFPLSPVEIMARNHAILCTVGFLILLPLGVLLARYARTFARR